MPCRKDCSVALQRDLPVVEATVVAELGEALAAAAGGIDLARLGELLPLGLGGVLRADGDPGHDEHGDERARDRDHAPACGKTDLEPVGPAVQPGEREAQARGEHHAGDDDDRGRPALVDGGRRRGVVGGEGVGAPAHGDGDGRRGHAGDQTRERAARAREQQVGDDADRHDEDRAAREGEEDGAREHRERGGGEHADDARLAQRRREVQARDPAHRAEEAERVPVRDRIAQAVGLERRADRPHVRQHAGDEADAADDERGGGEAPQDTTRTAEAAGHQPGGDEHEEVEQRPVELDERAGRRVGPAGGHERPDRVERERTDRERQRAARGRERVVGGRQPDEQDEPDADGRISDRAGEEAARVEGQPDDQRHRARRRREGCETACDIPRARAYPRVGWGRAGRWLRWSRKLSRDTYRQVSAKR